ncbi:MAG TPA: T9SS type A sorting domain-containing protein, partial [Paludibacter sp.]
NESKSPSVKAKIGNGSWINVSVQPFTDTWQTQSVVISPDAAQNLSLQIGRGSSTFDFEVDNVMIIGTKKTSAVKDVSAEALKLYPNPVKDILYAPKGVERIEILSLQGSTLISAVGNKVSLSELSKGIYIVRSFINGSSYVNKVVKD